MKNPSLIFDCDGVLIDSEAIYLDEEFRFLAARNIQVDRLQYVTEFMALAQPLWREKFTNLIQQHTGLALTDDEYEAMKRTIRARVLNEVQTISGIENLLDAVKVPTCVASSTSMKFLPGKLERTNLARYFGAHVFSGDQVENGKPAPDLFLHAAYNIKQPSDCIVIEDSANGVRGGKAAGMFTIGFTGGGHCFAGHGDALYEAGADLVVASHDELQTWLRTHTLAFNEQ
ncbi:MAG: HAD family phosphatase [Ahrensia sp.]|nr:HAD family phosphatase [Ahrensia sp.]